MANAHDEYRGKTPLRLTAGKWMLSHLEEEKTNTVPLPKTHTSIDSGFDHLISICPKTVNSIVNCTSIHTTAFTFSASGHSPTWVRLGRHPSGPMSALCSATGPVRRTGLYSLGRTHAHTSYTLPTAHTITHGRGKPCPMAPVRSAPDATLQVRPPVRP